MKVLNHTRGNSIATQVILADTFISRMVGLLNRESLGDQEGLLITRCQSIHMLFMRFPIDVVFLDKNHSVVGVVNDIKPFQFSPIFFKASSALELKSGTIRKANIKIGDQLILI